VAQLFSLGTTAQRAGLFVKKQDNMEEQNIKSDSAELQSEAEVMAGFDTEIQKIWPKGSYQTFVVINWVTGGILKDVALTVLSGAVGMSGPWLLAGGGKHGNVGVLVLLNNGNVTFITAPGKWCSVPLGWEHLDVTVPDRDTLTPITSKSDGKITSIRIKFFDNAPIHGVVNVSQPQGELNVSNASKLFALLADAKSKHMRAKEEFKRNDPKAWRTPAIFAILCISFPILSQYLAIRAFVTMRGSANQKHKWIAWVALLLSIAVLSVPITFAILQILK
jgi:hypothetical protein